MPSSSAAARICRTVEQIELILLAAGNVERLQPAEIVLCGLKIDDQIDGVSRSAVIRRGF
jgi:hypothetical protein